MKYGVVFIIILVLACQRTEYSLFDKTCTCEPIRFDRGILIKDSLNQFTLKTFESWNPVLRIENNKSLVIFGDSVNGSLSTVGINYGSYLPPWDWEEEVQLFSQDFELTNFGHTDYKGDTLYWVDVEEYDSYFRSRYIIQVDREKNKMLGIMLVTSDTVQPDTRICEMESILETIKIIGD